MMRIANGKNQNDIGLIMFFMGCIVFLSVFFYLFASLIYFLFVSFSPHMLFSYGSKKHI